MHIEKKEDQKSDLNKMNVFTNVHAQNWSHFSQAPKIFTQTTCER